MSDSGEDEKLTEEEREKKRHRNGVLEDRLVSNHYGHLNFLSCYVIEH